MAAHVIINARTRKICAGLNAPGEGTTIFAVDLSGDSWDDFNYFLDSARRFEDARDFQLRNRYLRVAVSSLFSHFDGTVGEIFHLIQSTDSASPPPSLRKRRRPPLREKMSAVSGYLRQVKAAQVEDVNLDLKLLRDIVNHPSITKSVTGVGPGEAFAYDSADVYGLGIEEVQQAAKELDEWLTAVCVAAGYARFVDTAALCADFARALGAPSRLEIRRF